jgi:hypothetical protein
MKRLVLGLGLLGIAIGSASGCDDARPVVGLPPDGQAGGVSQGGDPGTGGVAGGDSARAGTSSAGSLNQGGDGAAGGALPGTSGAPGLGGHNDGGQAAEIGGAGGQKP